MKVLLIRFSSAGDILLASEAVRALKGMKKKTSVFILTKEKFADAGAAAGADRVLTLKKGKTPGAVKEINSFNFDAVVDLQNNIRSFFIMSMAKSPAKAVCPKKGLKRRLMVFFKWFMNEKDSIAERYMKAVRSAVPGVKIKRRGAKKKSGKAKKVVIHDGARWKMKRWPYMRELAVELADKHGKEVIVTGLKSEVEKEGKMIYSKGVKDMAGKTDFRELVKIIRSADLFIGNDTAAAHIAGLSKVPAAVILGPTVRQFGFITPGNFIVVEKKLACRPCHPHGGDSCPIGTGECMKGIKPADVINAVKKYL